MSAQAEAKPDPFTREKVVGDESVLLLHITDDKEHEEMLDMLIASFGGYKEVKECKFPCLLLNKKTQNKYHVVILMTSTNYYHGSLPEISSSIPFWKPKFVVTLNYGKDSPDFFVSDETTKCSRSFEIIEACRCALVIAFYEKVEHVRLYSLRDNTHDYLFLEKLFQIKE
jgi:hypothetical protein